MNNDPKINVNEQPEAKEESKNTKVQKILKKHQEIVTKYKIDYVDIALGIVICLLTLIIISPPLLRKFVPKASVVENEKKALILSCSGINEEEKYKIKHATIAYIPNSKKLDFNSNYNLENGEINEFSPLAKAVIGKGVGDNFVFEVNGRFIRGVIRKIEKER